MKKYLILKILLVISIFRIQAQSSVNTAGGDGNGSNAAISYTVGQVSFEPISSMNNTFIPGVQQAYSTTTNSISNLNDKKIHIYPNPVNEYLNVIMNIPLNEPYFLYEIGGTLICKGTLIYQNNLINFNSTKPGLYYLKINTQTLKIIKI